MTRYLDAMVVSRRSHLAAHSAFNGVTAIHVTDKTHPNRHGARHRGWLSLEVLVPRLEPEGTAYQVVMNGLVFGLFDVVGRIFITLLKFMVVPLVLVTLVCGVSALGQSSRMGPIAAKNHRSLSFHYGVCCGAWTRDGAGRGARSRGQCRGER